MKVALTDQITEARRWVATLPPGPSQDAAEGIVLTLEFVAAYRQDFYEFMRLRSK